MRLQDHATTIFSRSPAPGRSSNRTVVHDRQRRGTRTAEPVWETDRSMPAFTDVMNRAADKPAQPMAVGGGSDRDGEVDIDISWDE